MNCLIFMATFSFADEKLELRAGVREWSGLALSVPKLL